MGQVWLSAYPKTWTSKGQVRRQNRENGEGSGRGNVSGTTLVGGGLVERRSRLAIGCKSFPCVSGEGMGRVDGDAGTNGGLVCYRFFQAPFVNGSPSKAHAAFQEYALADKDMLWKVQAFTSILAYHQ